MSESWPSGLSETLWNYHLLQAQDLPQVPMMGVKFASNFLYAFAFGCLFILFFAWRRFKETPSEPGSPGYRVIYEIEVTQLGGSNALRRAYLIYAGTLLVIYIAMTFFGKLILQTVGQLPIAGVHVDTSSLRFESAEWPLTLAFGLAGLGPLLPPLRLAEDWLRQRAYRAVGIPVRIQQTTRNIVERLDEVAKAEKGGRPGDLSEKLREKMEDLRERMEGTWIGTALKARPSKQQTLLILYAELEMLVEWARGARGSWPGTEVSEVVRALESKLVGEADELLDDFRQRIEDGKNPSTAEGDAPSDHGQPETHVAREQRRKVYLAETLKNMRRIRDELAAILAVYAERDPAYLDPGTDATEPAIRDARLRGLLRSVEPPNLAGSGPEFGILLCVVPAAILYAVFSWKGLHPAFTPNADPSGPPVIAATAGLETLRLLVIIWFPLLAAFSFRQYLSDDGDWVTKAAHDPSKYAEQRLAVLGIGLLVAVLGLIGLALLWAFTIAVSAPRFSEILFGGSTPFLLFYPSMALMVVPLVPLTLKAADARAAGEPALRYGLWGAALVCACYVALVAYWYGASRSCPAPGTFLLDLFQPGCFVHYAALNLFILPLLAFLAAVVFGNPSSITRRHRREMASRLRNAPAHALVLAPLLLMLGGAGSLGAQEVGSNKSPGDVFVGFRADVEPFSYRIDIDGKKQAGHRYAGFLADLCYEIFEGSGFIVREVEVTASDRFEVLRAKDETLTPGKIDLLCDPITMRFSDPRRNERGRYSPIVFASGVSYLQRRVRGGRTSLEIGYLRGSTAAPVAGRACEIDLFNVVPPDQRVGLRSMCDEAIAVANLAALTDVFVHLAESPGGLELPDAAILSADTTLRAAQNRRKAASYPPSTASASEKDAMKRDADRWDRVTAEVEKALDYLSGCAGTRGACARVPANGTPATIAKHLSASLKEVDPNFGDHCATEDPLPPHTSATVATPTADAADARLVAQRVVYRFCAKDSHADLIAWFCGRNYGPQSTNLVYLGDHELILGKLRGWNDKHAKCVGVENENGAEDLTYEPYALLVAKGAEAEIGDLVNRRVYEFFSHRARASEHFEAYFPGREMSLPLAYLFLLNAVEEERLFANPSEPTGDDPVWLP